MKPRFTTIAQLREFLPQLLDTRHRNLGKWTTAQILFHLAAAFEGSIEGIGVGYPYWVRVVIRPFRWVVTRFQFPPWLPIPKGIEYKLSPPASANLDQQYERLVVAIDRFAAHDGDHPPHPVLGRLSRNEWIGFQLRHCEHHLSFIEMVDESEP